MSRVSSSGSPTQWSATLSPLPASTWRSTQLTEALMVPPTNHLAKGGSVQSRTWSHFRPQSSRSAASAQNASRSASARAYASSLTLAAAAISAGGSKRRSSCIRFDRVCSDKALSSGGAGAGAGADQGWGTKEVTPSPNLLRLGEGVTGAAGLSAGRPV